jgi:site-specific DNA-methyltransferase (adenine-specific)
MRNGDSGLPWRGFNPTSVGRHWAIPRSLRPYLPNEGKGMSSQEQLEALYADDLIVFPKKEGGQPMYRQYVGQGVPYQDLWIYQPNTHGVLYGSDECIDEDVKYLEDEDERLGYETQKPVGLLRRIIVTSSDEGDVVLDPFCGCGTAIEAAHELKRQWKGIDVTHLSILVQKYRLETRFPGIKFNVVGEPKDISAACKLAKDNPYQFQWWALSLIPGAKPIGAKAGSKTGKKGKDEGIDGVVSIIDDMSGKPTRVLIQVKSGANVGPTDIRDLRGTVEREKAAMGVFVTMKNPTAAMTKEADAAGFHTFGWKEKYPRVQIVTIEGLLQGNGANLPLRHGTFTRTRRARSNAESPRFDLE